MDSNYEEGDPGLFKVLYETHLQGLKKITKEF